jgi:hypothetical protein
LPSPASMRSRVLSVSSKVIFPELPDASMDTLKPIAFPQCSAKQIFRIIADPRRRVNAENDHEFLAKSKMGAVRVSPRPFRTILGDVYSAADVQRKPNDTVGL